MKFTPKKESEISGGFKPLPSGTYPFTVLESDIQFSKSKKNAGKEMVKLKLNVHGPDFDKHVYDYFAEWFSEWKLKHFCDTAGLSSSYEAGEINPNENAYQGRTGYVKIGIETNEETGEERNHVVDYIVTAQDNKSTNPAKEEELDDIPF
ncbi:MAG: hypothetical protein K1X66_02280 [Verrucomicrobiae bacterium]|nr:hypothetical protein [Verrucomicrobiae bacterium]